MTRWRAIVLAACLAAVGCDEDPARSMKIAPRPVTARVAETAQVAPAGSTKSEKPPASPSARVGPTATAGTGASAKQGTATTAAASSGGTQGGSAASAAGTKPSREESTPGAARPSSEEVRIEGCPPPPEDGAGPSTLTATGPCAFQHQGMFSCELRYDDFYITAARKGARGATMMIYVNVEHYKGPGAYKDAQMYVGVQDRTSIYRWSSDTVDITVGPGEQFAVLPSTRLDAEPVLVACSGPMTNFQCGGRDTLFEAPPVVVAGTMRCEGGAKKK